MTFGFSSSSGDNFFLDKKTQEFPTHSVNLILSPSFYWTRLQELPVHTVYGAREYSASIFEGLLPQGKWTYFVQKEQSGLYRFFAFCQDDILNFVETIGGDKENIKSLYFAQNEFGDVLEDDESRFISINSQNCITKANNTVVLVPQNMISNSVDIKDILDNIKLSNNDIKIDTQISINTDIFMVLVAIGFIFSLGFIVNIIDHNIKISNLENKIKQRIKTLGLPETSFELEALEKQSYADTQNQINIRKNIKQISSIKVAQYGKIKKIVITKEKLSIYD